MKHTQEDLKAMQAWPFARKIQVTQTRIMEWYQHFDGAVCVSFSGGKDSSVLLDLARRCYPDIEAVYVDTRLEFPEVRQFAMSKSNVTVLRPKMRFDEVLREYGWCYPSKDVAHTLYYARKGSGCALRRLAGIGEGGEPSKYRQSHYVKWAFLKDSKFTISSRCCEVMKEKPLTEHQKRTGKRAMVGTLADESHRRR